MVHGKFEQYMRASGFLAPACDSVIAKKRRFFYEQIENSESADTELFPLTINSDGTSCVKALLHSGRMHQIRATLFSLGYPVVGDKLYGLDETLYNKISTQSFTDDDRRKLILPNQALHCSNLEFIHPVNKQKFSFESSPAWSV